MRRLMDLGILRFLLLLAGAFFAGATGAQNLLVNASFSSSSGLSGWTFLTDADIQNLTTIACSGTADCGSFQFSPSECCSAPGSGSAKTSSSFFYGNVIAQCVSGVVAGSAYDFGAWMRITSVPGVLPALPGVRVMWFSTSDCSGTSSSNFAGPPSAPWERVGEQAVAPLGAQSARFLLRAGQFGLQGSSVDSELDSAFFGPSGSVPVELESFSIE